MSIHYSEFLKWMPFVAAVAAWVAAIFAYLNARRSRQALRLAELQEARRRPVLVPYLQRGYTRRVNGDRLYMFLLSMSNPSDSGNAIARIDLRIEYRNPSNFLTTVEVPSSSHADEMVEVDGSPYLKTPIRIDAHHTEAGWVLFSVNNALLENCAVNTYIIVSTDSHGERVFIETAIVQELVHEAEIYKN